MSKNRQNVELYPQKWAEECTLRIVNFWECSLLPKRGIGYLRVAHLCQVSQRLRTQPWLFWIAQCHGKSPPNVRSGQFQPRSDEWAKNIDIINYINIRHY